MAVDSASEETPIVSRPLFRGTPDTFLRGSVLYAPAEAVLRAVAPGRRLVLRDSALLVDGERLEIRPIVRNGRGYVPVRELARRFGAYSNVNGIDGSIALWPRDVLLYWRDQGDPRSPAVLGAIREGLIDPPQNARRSWN